MDGEFQDSGPVRTVGTLGPRADVGAHAVVCGLRTALSTRGTTLVSVEYLRLADAGADPQFHFSHRYQFHGDYRHPPVFVGWADGLSSGRNSKSVGPA